MSKMNVFGVAITDDQQAAALAAMQGEFKMMNVVSALVRAGVDVHGPVAGRAADRLLQRERKAGRIKAVDNKNWVTMPRHPA